MRHRLDFLDFCVKVWLICCAMSVVFSFNLEVRIPVIKQGEKGSYFGYSVAEHRDSSNTAWMLVGAPLGQNLQPETNRSGALFKCPLSTISTDCKQILTDGRRSNDNNLWPPGDDEQKDDQWMGVTVSSASNATHAGKVAVCAHRYVLKPTPEARWGQGLCYTLSEDFDMDNIWEPCKGKSVKGEHEEYGFCQAGTSSTIVGESLIVGAPGPYTWTGTLFVMDTKEEFIDRDKEKYHGPLGPESPTPKYSYMGMSVTAGLFDSGSPISYAAGAPRAGGAGQVLIFRKKNSTNPMEIVTTLEGQQFASSFGYEIANADIDGDSWSDLLVGAPFYFEKDVGGAVYVYRNNKGILPTKFSTRLLGPRVESRFGFALASLGDINRDGCDDIAIGAPYEGLGAVYIYLGSREGLQEKPAQVIRAAKASAISTPTFGYSLSGGLDLDRNGYPDLLIGAYSSDSIILLRARPIIDIHTELKEENALTSIDPGKPGCNIDPYTNFTCFSFQTCAKIRGQSSDVELLYHLVSDTAQSRKSRVWFNDPNDQTKPSEVSKKVKLQNGQHCERHILYLKEGTRDILHPIKFRLNYTLVQKETEVPFPGSALPSIDLFPVLNQTQAERIFEANFLKDCGDDLLCTSDLSLDASLILPKNELLLGKQNDFRVHVELQNLDEPAYDPWLYIEHPPSLDYISSKVRQDSRANCNLFNKTIVACKISNPLKKGNKVDIILRFDPKNLVNDITELKFIIYANSTSTEKTPKRPTILKAKVVRKADVSIRGSARPEQVFFGGVVKGESVMKFRDDVGSQVIHFYEVYNDGPWVSGQLEVKIQWPHQVANNKEKGKWLLYLVEEPTLDNKEDGSCFVDPSLVNPLQLQTRSGVPEPLMEQLLDPRNHTKNSESSGSGIGGRMRRDTDMVIRSEPYVDSEGRKTEGVTMSCLDKSAKCITITCKINPLYARKQAVIRISARLWNATLVEDYSQKHLISIVSAASVINRNNPNIEISANATTKAYPDLLEQLESPVQLWIIILSVIIGLVLLVGIALLLWKCGFFERRRPDPTLSGNIEKHREDSPFLQK